MRNLFIVISYLPFNLKRFCNKISSYIVYSVVLVHCVRCALCIHRVIVVKSKSKMLASAGVFIQHFLRLSVILICFVSKLPQIIRVVRTESANGIYSIEFSYLLKCYFSSFVFFSCTVNRNKSSVFEFGSVSIVDPMDVQLLFWILFFDVP